MIACIYNFVKYEKTALHGPFPLLENLTPLQRPSAQPVP